MSGWQAEQAERSRRKARPGTCRKCGAAILTGPDADRAAIPATVDPEPVDRPARPGDYAIHAGELHYLDQPPLDNRPAHRKHTCQEGQR